jgi:excinuclease ABC subunit C
MTRKLALKIENLPDEEGIFCFYNEQKQPFYVGVAKNIKEEVGKTLSDKHSFLNNSKIDQIKFAKSTDKNLIKLFAETIRRRKPLFNISLAEQNLYPHLKITGEEFPRLLVTRKIETDGADYFGAFLPETGLRFLLDCLNRTFRLRNCTIPIDGNFPVPCTQFYEKRCVAPCVENICDKTAYVGFVQLVRLFLEDKRESLEISLQEKIASAADVLDFETAAFWRDILLSVHSILNEKDLQLRLDYAIDSVEITEKNEEIFIYLVTQRGRKILGKRVFAFEKRNNFALEFFLTQFLWQFYQFHAPKEIRTALDFPNRNFLSEVLSRRENRKIEINVAKSADRKITTERAFGHTKFEFDFRQIKLPLGFRDIQNDLVKEFNLKRLPKRIECFDVAHISGTNFVAAKAVWVDGEFLANEYQFWVFEENNELKMLGKGIEKSFETNETLPDLVLIDGGKPQLNAALNALEKSRQRKFSLIAAVKPPRRHNEISHFIAESGEIFAMKPDSDAMQLLVRLRDEAHEIANHIHRAIRDTSHFYELASILPDLSEKERNSLLQKFGSIKNLKRTVESDFVEMFGNKKGKKIFVALNSDNFDKKLSLKSLIVPVRYDDPNGEATNLQPLRLRHKKRL